MPKRKSKRSPSTSRQFNSYPVQEVASGSVILAQCWNGNAKQAIDASKNENLVFVYPEPISELWLDSYHLPTGGKNLKAAHSWINYVLDPVVAAREITYTGFLVAGLRNRDASRCQGRRRSSFDLPACRCPEARRADAAQ